MPLSVSVSDAHANVWDLRKSEEGRIWSAGRVEAHLFVNLLSRTFLQPDVRTAGT